MDKDMKLRKFIATTIREYLNEQQVLNEKTLYHGTTIYNLPSIEQNGLMPTIGDFVKNMYAGSVDGDVMDYLEEILYATDKKQLDKARTAIVYQIANKLGKDYHSVTNEEFEKYGALAVVKNGDEYFDFHSEENQYYGRAPLGVETGDYYTRDEITPDYILTGKKLTSFFKKFGLYPIKQNMNENRLRNVNEAYDDVSMDYIKSRKKLSEYKNYDDKIVIGNNTYLNFIEKDDDWFLWGYVYVFDNADETEIANASYGKVKEYSNMKASIDVRSDKRRLGIASNIYQWIEKLTGYKLYPDTPHSKSAEAFWNNPNRKFGFDK